MSSYSDYDINIPSGRLKGQIKTTCPRCSHDRKKKSDKCLSVNLDTECWFCHHCAWTGHLNGKSAEPVEWKNETNLPDHVVEWFVKRNIKQSTLMDMGIKWGEHFFPQSGKSEACIIFPYAKDGRIVNNKYRTLDKSFVMDSGAELCVYNHRALTNEIVWIVEGEMDCLTMIGHGYPGTVSVPNGASTGRNNLKYIDMDEWDHVSRINILTDNDEPGHKLAKDLIALFGADRCTRWLPGHHKDVNEQLCRDGAITLIPQQDQPGTLIQYCGFWSNNFTTQIELSTGRLRTHLTEVLGYYSYEGSGYVQVVDGVVYQRDARELYTTVVSLVSETAIEFDNVRVGRTEITMRIDPDKLATRAQKELRGNMGIFALPAFDKDFYRDTAKDIYLHFLNGTLHITADEVRLIERTNDKVVWERQVIQHNISDKRLPEGVFFDFIQNIAGDQLKSFITTIGYLLRNYNESAGLRAVWLTDEDYEVGKANGRTGKGIFWKAISKVRKTDQTSGKDWTPDYQFKFQTMEPDTQVFVIDDVKESFAFQAMYNYCTEGGEYQKKHQQKVKLSVEQTPKLVITSNYPPRVEEGPSTTGRLIVLPVKPYYSKYAEEGGVKAVHGHYFFDDWTEEEWDRFYWFMAMAGQEYLRDGLILPSPVSIRKNRLKHLTRHKLKSEDIAEDFCGWVYGYAFPAKFTLDDVLVAFGSEVDKQNFAACLKAFFTLEGRHFIKRRERFGTKQMTVWCLE